MTPEDLDGWLQVSDLEPADLGIRILTERDNARERFLPAICQSVADHLVGSEVLDRLDFSRAAQIVRDALPVDKRIRSGDLAEVIASEYVEWKTEFRLPLKRLRYKDDRDFAMKGDDLIALEPEGERPRVLKGEVKSRAAITEAVIEEACNALERFDSRPKPATLAYISRMLRMFGRDAEATRVEELQTAELPFARIAHIIFVMSGTDPEPCLRPLAGPKPPIEDRWMVGFRIDDHQEFIALVFQRLNG
jgi:hypothetical protein